MLPLLSQTGLLWQVLLARFMLGKQLGCAQIGGVALVVAGVALAAWPAKGAGSVLANVSALCLSPPCAGYLLPWSSCFQLEAVQTT